MTKYFLKDLENFFLKDMLFQKKKCFLLNKNNLSTLDLFAKMKPIIEASMQVQDNMSLLEVKPHLQEANMCRQAEFHIIFSLLSLI